MPGIRDEIRSQPTVIRKTVEVVSAGLSKLTPYAAELKSGRPVIITGMGGSYSAGMLLQYGLIESGIPAFVIESSELLYHQQALLANKPLIVMISQSGESREIVRLLDELTTRRTDCTVVGLTNTPNSTLAQRSTHTLMMQAGDEKTVSTKTYTCTLAALILLNSVLTGSDHGVARQALEQAAQALETSLPTWETQAKQVAERIKATTFLECLGRGAAKASAFTAALITKETAKLPTEAMVGGGFRHGPIEVVTPEISVMIFMGSGTDRSLNDLLAADIEAREASVIRIGSAIDHELGFNLPALADFIMPLVEIVPAQLVAVELAALRGFTPGEFRYIAKVTTKE
ncbi:MAG TPA: SIS domain-containing protein [Phototrophicaceae bacterium]|nr:SIS domain-containing protein [Phototrophicaceae bacterium]